MVDTPVVRIEANGDRNAIVRLSLKSDGSGLANYKLFDASSAGVFGVRRAGQTFYPGLHTALVGMDFDVDGMRAQLLWEASANEEIVSFGASPESFDWKGFGGIRVPSGLAGATGSILVTTIAAAANATLGMVLYIR